MVRSPELGTRVEATLAGRAFLRAVDVSAEAQLGAGGEEQAAALIDAARSDVAARPDEDGVRSARAIATPGSTGPMRTEPALFPGRSDAADAWGCRRARVVPPRRRDRRALSRRRERARPQLGRTRARHAAALRPRGAGSCSATSRRAGGSPAAARTRSSSRGPGTPSALLGRATWAHAKTLGVDRDEVGLLASAAAELGRHFGLRALRARPRPIKSAARAAARRRGASPGAPRCTPPTDRSRALGLQSGRP